MNPFLEMGIRLATVFTILAIDILSFLGALVAVNRKIDGSCDANGSTVEVEVIVSLTAARIFKQFVGGVDPRDVVVMCQLVLAVGVELFCQLPIRLLDLGKGCFWPNI